jgi:hypothetical protein
MTGSKPLDQATLKDLLAPKPKPKAKSPQAGKDRSSTAVPQNGPLKFFDKEKTCLNSGYYAIDPETNERYYKKSHGRCGSPTHWELDGVPYCHIHVLYKMNEMLMELRGQEPTPTRG